MVAKVSARAGAILIFLLTPLTTAMAADNLVWKVTIISAIPSRPNVPADFCQRFSPDIYGASLNQLQQTGATAENGMLVKYQSVQTRQENELFFTGVNAVISKQLHPGQFWHTHFYIHLQQLTANGVADGVWSTLDCKGRLIAQPQSKTPQL